MPPTLPTPLTVLGHALHPVDVSQAAAWVLEASRDAPAPRLVVTLNPEIIVRARQDQDLARALARADLTVADGVGVLWAAKRAGQRLPGRVPGVELAFAVLARGGPALRVALLGGRPGVAERAAREAERRWGVTITGARHGYFDRESEVAAVAAEVAEGRPHLLLAGLGEGQELLLDRHREAWGARVSIGVGGTLDVLAGVTKRTPVWTRRVGLEWAWRVGLDPARWHRIPHLLAFVRLAVREGRG